MQVSVAIATLLYVKVHLYVYVTGAGLSNVQTDGKKNDVLKRGTINAIGDFKESLGCTTYVDKTLMIEDFFKNSGFRQYHLVTCPHKFGKTTNLDMLRRFVEGGIKIEKDITILPFRSSEDRELFLKSHQKLKIQPLLKNDSDLFSDHFQQYATIYVTFKVTGAKTYNETVQALWKNFRTCFGKHKQVFNRMGYGTVNDILPYYKIMDHVLRGSFQEDDLVEGLFALTRILATYYPYSKIFLLVDDYDDPVMHAIEYNFDVTKVVQLIDRIFSTLFNEHHRGIQQALITGTLNILDRNKFSSIRHWSFLESHQFTRYFGFTEDEVDQLLDSHGTEKLDRDLVKRYYDAYNVFHSPMRIYNLYSITNYLASRSLNDQRHGVKHYWAGSSLISNFWRSFELNEPFEELLNTLLTLHKVTFSLKEHWNSADLEELKIITHGSEMTLTVYRTDLILSYLYHNGFLSYTNETNVFCVPENEEIKACLNRSSVRNSKLSILDKDAIKAKLSPRT